MFHCVAAIGLHFPKEINKGLSYIILSYNDLIWAIVDNLFQSSHIANQQHDSDILTNVTNDVFEPDVTHGLWYNSAYVTQGSSGNIT